MRRLYRRSFRCFIGVFVANSLARFISILPLGGLVHVGWSNAKEVVTTVMIAPLRNNLYKRVVLVADESVLPIDRNGDKNTVSPREL